MKNKNDTKRIPKLRFPEFRDAPEWEEKPLSDISPSIFDGTHQTPTYTVEGVPFYSVENIVSGNKNKFISQEDYIAATIKNKPEKDDILLTRIGKIGFSKVVDWDHDFSIYVTLAVIKKSILFNSYYLHYFIQSDRYQSEILKKSLLNAVPCKINMDSLRQTLVLLPKYNEQQKIAECLASLDDLIAAHTRKLDALKAHKKGLMQQLFPAEGETAPRLRFPEFTNEPMWKEMRLGDFLIEQSRETKKPSKPYTGLGIRSHGKGTFIKELQEPEKNSMERLYEVAKNDLIVNITFAWEGAIAIANDCDQGALVSHRFPRYTFVLSTAYTDFFRYVIIKKDFVYKLALISPGGAGRNRVMNKKDFLKIKVNMPSLNEQQKIAGCLSSIDELIAAQARKLAALKAHKKGLMQQLFPAATEGLG